MDLIFNGVSPSADWGFVAELYPSHEIPKRNVTVVSIPGRDGDLTIDNGNWINIPATYKCHWIQEHDSDVTEWLNQVGYCKLKEVGTDWFYLARFKGGVELENICGVLTQAKLKFDCKPLRYLDIGESSVTVSTSGSTVTNLGTQNASPLISVSIRNGGSGSISFNGYALEFANVPGNFIFDCESLECYSATGENYNSYVSGFNMPVLKPGNNAVFFDGDITSLSIKGRWVRK